MHPQKETRRDLGALLQPQGLYLLLLVICLPCLEWIMPKLLLTRETGLTTTGAWLSLAVADLVGLLLLIPMRSSIRSLTFCLGWKDLVGLPAALIAGWMVIPGVQALTSSLPGFNLSPLRSVSLIPHRPSAWMALLVGALLAAITQELLYRGLLWGKARRLSGVIWIAHLVSAFLFALLYLPSGPSTFLAVGLAWGLVASVYYGWSQSVTGVIALNALNLLLTYGVLFRYL